MSLVSNLVIAVASSVSCKAVFSFLVDLYIIKMRFPKFHCTKRFC